MGREILFRGKRIDNGQWVEGYLMDTDYINVPFNDNDVCGRFDDPIEVDIETVCQYTGLTDKNGRKIFEGDIANCYEKRGAAFWHCKVVWNEVKARFDVIAMDCAFPMCLDAIGGDISINGLDYEVIGNIFDNLDLL